MRRINTATKAIDLFGAGKHGWKNGVPGTSNRPTEGEAPWFNSVQEELANVIEASGVSLNPGSNTQLLEALRSGIGILQFVQELTGAIERNVRDKLRERVSAADVGIVPGNVIAYSASNLSTIIAELAAEGKTLHFAAGIYLFDTEILIGNGASVEGAGSGYSDNATAFTRFVCASNAATSVVRVYDPIATYIEVNLKGIWATYSTQFDHVTFAANPRRCFYFQSQLTNSTLDDLYATEGRYGYYSPLGFWSCKLGTLSAALCYVGAHWGETGLSTSLAIRALQVWLCFHGAFIGKTSYSSLNFYVDTCGLSAPSRLQVATEAPVMLALSETKVAIGAFGSEHSNGLQIVARSFSTAVVGSTRLDQQLAGLWSYNVARSLPEWVTGVAKQALFATSDSVLDISGLASTLSGRLPATNDLFAASSGSLSERNGIVFRNSFVDGSAYTIDFPRSSTDPAAPYFSTGIRAENVMTLFAMRASSNTALTVNIDERGVGAEKLTPALWRTYKREYLLQKATGAEGWEAGTTMALALNVRPGLDHWGGSLLILLQPSEAAGAARAQAGVQEVLLEVSGSGASVAAVTLKRSTAGGITATLDGGHPTFILLNGLVNRINYDLAIQEGLNRFCVADFPVSLIQA